jgi:hypothetical protein
MTMQLTVRSLLAILLVGISTMSTSCPHSSSPQLSTEQSASDNAAVIPQDEAESDVLFSLDESSYITLPENWESDRELHETATIQASNRDDDLYLIVLAEEKPDPASASSSPSLQSIDEYSDRVLERLSTQLSDVEINGPTATLQVDNYPARQFILRGKLDGVEGVYVLTIVETANTYYQLLAWSIPEQFSEVQNRLQQVIQSFRELPRSRPTQQRPRPVPDMPIRDDAEEADEDTPSQDNDIVDDANPGEETTTPSELSPDDEPASPPEDANSPPSEGMDQPNPNPSPPNPSEAGEPSNDEATDPPSTPD